MKRVWRIAGGLWLSVGLAQAAESSFSKSVDAAEFSAAGLGKLSAEELARLDALVQRFKSGAVPQTIPGRPSEAPKPAAEPRPAAPARTITITPGTEVRSSTVESRIAGEFRGWQGNTILRLESGQRWKVVAGQNYTGPAMTAPAVKIAPGTLGTFWMTVEGVRVRVKVEPVE